MDKKIGFVEGSIDTAYLNVKLVQPGHRILQLLLLKAVILGRLRLLGRHDDCKRLDVLY